MLLKRRHCDLAERIVQEDWLKNPTKKSPKLREMVEFDVRLQFAKGFMEKWNYWRKFYFDLPPIQPKTKGQLTSIENVLDLVKKERLNLNILIGAVHRHFVYKKFHPSYSTLLHQGVELYERHYDKVVEDVNRQHYQDEALRFE